MSSTKVEDDKTRYVFELEIPPVFTRIAPPLVLSLLIHKVDGETCPLISKTLRDEH